MLRARTAVDAHAGPDVHRGAGRVAHAVARQAIGRAPAGAARRPPAAGGAARRRRAVGRRPARRARRARAAPAGIDEPGAGARMLEAITALHLVYRAAPVEEALALIERASARRVAAGGGRGPVHRRRADGADDGRPARRRWTTSSRWSSARTGAARSSACSPCRCGAAGCTCAAASSSMRATRCAPRSRSSRPGTAPREATSTRRRTTPDAVRARRRRGRAGGSSTRPCATQMWASLEGRAGGTASSASCCSRPAGPRRRWL